MAKIIKKYNGVYATHIRDEIDNFQEALKEAIEVARESKVKLHISHFKIIGEKNWGLMDEAMFLIGKAKEDGIDITFDVYPYTNTGTVLYTLLPAWVTDGGRKMMLSRLKDKAIRPRIIREMKDSGFDYSKVEIAISALDKTLDKRKIIDIAKSQEKSVENAILDILIASEGRVITSMEVLSAGNVNQAISHPLSIIATNGAGYNLEHAKTGEQGSSAQFRNFCQSPFQICNSGKNNQLGRGNYENDFFSGFQIRPQTARSNKKRLFCRYCRYEQGRIKGFCYSG